LPFG
jgi:DNA (cytosine-5)-methyltransferase 1